MSRAGELVRFTSELWEAQQHQTWTVSVTDVTKLSCVWKSTRFGDTTQLATFHLAELIRFANASRTSPGQLWSYFQLNFETGERVSVC